MSRLDVCKEIFEKQCKNTNGFNKHLKNAVFLDVRNSGITAEIKICEEHTNQFGWMHGAFAATVLDCITSLALMCQYSGMIVSISMNLSYVKAAKKDEVIVLEAEVINVGLTVALIEGTIKNKAGDILVKCTHTMYLGK